MTETPAIRFRGVSKSFGANQVLNDVTFDVMPGTLTVVAGPNGSGKSTLLNITSGLVAPERGEVTIFGSRSGSRTASSAVARLLEYPLATSVLAVRDVPHMLQFSPQEGLRFRSILDAIGTSPDARVGRMSRGTFTRLAVAAAFAQAVKVVLLDEPTVGLDLHAETTLHGLVDDAVRTGITVVVAAHHLGLISPSEVDQFVVVEQGRVQVTGEVDPGSISILPDLSRSYLSTPTS